MLFTSLVDHLAGRRQFLQSAAGLGAAGLGAIAMPGLTGEAKAAGHTTINFEDPAENLKAYIKLTANLDPTVETCGWFGGTLYANIGVEKMMPLVGVEGLGVMASSPRATTPIVFLIVNSRSTRTQRLESIWKIGLTRIRKNGSKYGRSRITK
jgi:hypothetical protein